LIYVKAFDAHPCQTSDAQPTFTDNRFGAVPIFSIMALPRLDRGEAMTRERGRQSTRLLLGVALPMKEAFHDAE